MGDQMAKFSLKVFKNGKPIYWIVGAVILFVIFYFLFSRGAPESSSGGVTVNSSGPSEQMQAAQLAASTQMQTAQLGAQIEMARVQGELASGQLGAQVALAQLHSAETIGMASLAQEGAIANLAAQTQIILNDQNVEYTLESARLASETQLANKLTDASILMYQMDTNRDMLQIQSTNMLAQSAIGQVSNLKKKDRDNALVALTASLTGNPVNYTQDKSGGGLGGLLSFISPLANAIA